MNSIKKVPFLILVLSAQLFFGQEIKFGDVSIAELEEAQYDLDKDANAAVLYRYQNTYYLVNGGVSSLVTEVQERIKIYNNEGFEYATEYINLFKGRSTEETVRKIKAYTYNLENGKVVKTELDKDQIFKSDLSYNYEQVKFTMPQVKAGSIVEFKYKINSPYIWNIDDFRFQREIPVKRIEAQMRTPKGFNYKKTSKGHLYFRPVETTVRDARIGMEVQISTYKLTNIPALKDEPFVDHMGNYRSGVMFELHSIDLPGFPTRKYSQSWADVAKNIGNSDDFKNKLDKTRSFDDEIDDLIANEPDLMKKTELLFKHVKETTEWNGVDGKYFQYGIKKTLKEKKGNAADINLLLVAMLRYAGIDANPVVLSTKENAKPYFPTLERLNYVIAHAKIGDQSYFMDATEEFGDIDVLPVKDYNWGGLLIDNNRQEWKRIYNIQPPKSKNRYSLKFNIDATGTMEGNYFSRLSKHKAIDFRESVKDKDIETIVTDRESQFSGIEIDEYELKNEKTYKGPVSENFSFNTDYGTDLIGNKIYVTPMSFLVYGENPFKQDKREFPVDFGYSFSDNYLITITIPDGYSVESLPKPISVTMIDDLGKFKYIIKNVGNQIQLSVTFDMNKAMIQAGKYGALREFFNQVIAKQAEQIVLSKSIDGTSAGTGEGR